MDALVTPTVLPARPGGGLA